MLTKKQKELLDYITVVNKKFGISPSYDEMKDKLKLKSKSGIHRIISALEEKPQLPSLKTLDETQLSIDWSFEIKLPFSNPSLKLLFS